MRRGFAGLTRVAVAILAIACGCDNAALPLSGDDSATPPDLAVAVHADLEFPGPTCDDAVRNGGETDVDCGGHDCQPCDLAQSCARGSDCTSGVCDPASHTCASCSDGVKSGQETDVDCGGPVCAPCGTGAACVSDSDCLAHACHDGVCGTFASCAAILRDNPKAADGTYTIDPDGPGGAAPFSVWCDMTFDGGGWTALPLRFADPALWSITHSGSSCTSAPQIDKNGSLLFFQNASASQWSYVSMRFVPPLAVRQVALRQLTHATATKCNNMDLLYTVTPASTGDETAESWYFAGDDSTVPLAYTFAAGCASAHYTATGGMPPECQMDLMDATTQLTRQLKLSKPAAHFNMVAVEGCGSSICDAGTGQAERFYVNHPSQNGQWKDGILVR